MLLLVIATLCAGLFAGAAAFVTFVEHPARMECGVPFAVREFGPSYRRAAVMQASLALVGLFAAVAGWVEVQDVCILIGGALLGATVPFTLTAILPTTRRLLDPGLDPSSPVAAELLGRWGRLHAVRTAVSVLAFALLLSRLG